MASIIPFIKPEDGAFDDEVARNMGQAFNAAVQVLRSTAQPAVVYAASQPASLRRPVAANATPCACSKQV